MNYFWTFIDEQDWSVKTKYAFALVTLGILFGLCGFALWLIIRNWGLSTVDWMLCFIGYPVLFSLYVVFFYSCRHEFQ